MLHVYPMLSTTVAKSMLAAGTHIKIVSPRDAIVCVDGNCYRVSLSLVREIHQHNYSVGTNSMNSNRI